MSEKGNMYIVTGGAGFIGSALIAALNAQGHEDILVVDELGTTEKWKNLRNKRFSEYLHKDNFLKLVSEERLPAAIKGIIHLGACSTTTERDVDYLYRNNFLYSRTLAEYALKKKIRFIYASSAATYGAGEHGYSDDPAIIPALLPLNPYGYSKQLFDLWLLRQRFEQRCVGLKFFNVYGPNEYHKDGQFSVVYSAFNQVLQQGRVRLFKSYRPGIADGEQKRDFVYVKDCVSAICWFLQNSQANGIYNLGSGVARSFNDLAKAVFAALNRPTQIDYIDMPEGLRAQYQYYTQADMSRLRKSGCSIKFHTLEDGVKDYVTNHLQSEQPYW